MNIALLTYGLMPVFALGSGECILCLCVFEREWGGQ